MKHLPLTMCALALAVSTSIGASACTEGGETDPCEAYCEKTEECTDDSYNDCYEPLGTFCDEDMELPCEVDCRNEQDCEDFLDCREDCYED